MLLHPDTYTTKHLLCPDNAASLQMFYNHISFGMFLFEHDDMKILSL